MRCVERMQLLAEEKWLQETLTRIKNNRNALQIERLQLESMLLEIITSENQTTVGNALVENALNALSTQTSEKIEIGNSTSPLSHDFEHLFEENESSCNNVELNLDVNDHGHLLELGNNALNSEEEEDMEEDDDIDMDFFMNVPVASQSQDSKS